MHKKLILFFLPLLFFSCTQNKDNFQKFLEEYWKGYLKFHPLEASEHGIHDMDGELRDEFSDEYRSEIDSFYRDFQQRLETVNTEKLNENDKISYEILKRELDYGQEYLELPNQYLPINQFHSLPLTFAQLGSGQSYHPFETKRDYHNFISRMRHFQVWVATAIRRMKQGIEKNIVLPDVLVQKVIAQYDELLADTSSANLFFQPLTNLDSTSDVVEPEKLHKTYSMAVREYVFPSYELLRDFMKNEYLAHARSSDGYSSLPDGEKWYHYWVRKWTTSNMSPEEIYNTGIDEVAYLQNEMKNVMQEVDFEGDLQAFFRYTSTDPQFRPFSTAQEVLDSFERIYSVEQEHLNTFFDIEPKTKFEIRQTEKFREKTASAEYQPADEEGTRPGIFYCPIPDPKEFVSVGMETLFLHEAIPGHHYQVSLQQENKELPDFRKFIWYGAYGEGWALYAETLGRDLGLYGNPYQYFGHLSDAMLRAVRLVVDVGLHTGKMSREEAIGYMRNNMRISEDEATQEIERYIAIPGQALSYMIGKKKIIALRDAAKKKLGEKFDIKKFHTLVLQNGCLPLDLLEKVIDTQL